MMSSGEFEIPEARVDDLDLDNPADRTKWEERLAELAARRLEVARRRLERMGIITPEGRLVSEEAPPDMSSTSDASVDTG